MCGLVNEEADPSMSGIDTDKNLHENWQGLSNNETITQWLDPAWYNLNLPELEITESLSFNLVSFIICKMMRHGFCSKR